jgi:hypothetical protein
MRARSSPFDGLRVRTAPIFMLSLSKHEGNSSLSKQLPPQHRVGRIFMRSGLLWLIGIPLPIIIILWLITGHA